MKKHFCITFTVGLKSQRGRRNTEAARGPQWDDTFVHKGLVSLSIYASSGELIVQSAKVHFERVGELKSANSVIGFALDQEQNKHLNVGFAK